MSYEPKVTLFRLIAFVVILLFSAATFYYLSLRLLSRIHLHRAKNYSQEGHYDRTIRELKKAHHYQPEDYLIHRQLGDVYLKLGELKPRKGDVWQSTLKAKEYFSGGVGLNPFDAETAFGLARSEARLEQWFPYFNSMLKSNPYKALPYFKEAIRLRPNGTQYHQAFAGYLYHRKEMEELLTVVSTLARIYPYVYHELKKESYWSPPVKDAFKKGLLKAVEQGNSPREGHMALSSIFYYDKKYAEAIAHYREALGFKAFKNGTRDYFYLGSLYLKNWQIKEAEGSFLKGLTMSQAREKDLEGIYGLFKSQGLVEELYGFYGLVKDRFRLSRRMDILLARSLMDLKQYNQAQMILTDLNRKKPTAEVYYWLSRVAEIQKDWNGMELAIQKATVLDPRNSRYRQIFFSLLKRLGKLDTAENELGLIIQHSDKPSPGLFNERARMRWNRKDYFGAVDDWKSAIRLAPRTASYYAQAAEGFIKVGDLPQAIEYYQRAVKLDPKNKRYKKRYGELGD